MMEMSAFDHLNVQDQLDITIKCVFIILSKMQTDSVQQTLMLTFIIGLFMIGPTISQRYHVRHSIALLLFENQLWTIECIF